MIQDSPHYAAMLPQLCQAGGGAAQALYAKALEGGRGAGSQGQGTVQYFFSDPASGSVFEVSQ